MKLDFTRLLTLSRERKRLLMVGADVLMLPVALWCAFLLRLAEPFPQRMLDAWWLFVLVPVAGVVVFTKLGLYRAVVRYMGTRAIWSVAIGVMVLAVITSAAAMLSQAAVPRSVPFIFATLAFVYVGGTRFLVRAWYHSIVARGSTAEPVIIYGAGVAGAQLVNSLRIAGHFHPVAFVDDDPGLRGSVIDGIRIHGPEDIDQLLELFPVRRVLLAIPSASRARRKRILDLLEPYPVHVQTMPSLDDMFKAGAKPDQLRDIDIADLLGRDPVPPISELMAAIVQDRVVLVSGAGGSIGSALCRVVLAQGARALVLYEQSEYALYTIERELRAYMARRNISCDLYAVLGSVDNEIRARATLRRFRVQTVFHAAAYKHVPMVEHNVLEGIRNNVFGTQVFAEVAAEHGVERFILISTDKAVRPTNVMGATKRLAELVLQDLASRSTSTVFAMVRFGNVLASSGSVVPLFHEQIGNGGPVTVTHPQITRYFMTLSEAAELVVQAGAMATGGEVFLLDMGEPVRIIDLAQRMIRLQGLSIRDENHPDGDIAIEFVGLRPGEKLFEELLVGDNATGTRHPKIMRAEERALDSEEIRSLVRRLREAEAGMDVKSALELLQSVIPDFRPTVGSSDWFDGRQRQGGGLKVVKMSPPGKVPSAPGSATHEP
jgi:FlaA1/EpsC-like NDP-sugar epimerase